MKKYLINEVCRITGLSRATVLYYEEKGLIEPVQEDYSGYRKYSMKDIATIMFYQSLKNVGVSVSEYVDVLKQKNGPEYSDVYELVLNKKSIYLRRMMSFLSMWDETLATTYSLRSQKMIIRMQESRGAWTMQFGKKHDKADDIVFKDWNDYFLEKNVSCFFSMKKLVAGDDSFESGLSCYEDCALPLPQEFKARMKFRHAEMCVMELVPFDLNSGSFKKVIDDAVRYANDRDYDICGDPWGHFGLRDEFNGVSTDYLSLWVPVAPRKHY